MNFHPYVFSHQLTRPRPGLQRWFLKFSFLLLGLWGVKLSYGQVNVFDSTWVHRIHFRSSTSADKTFRFISNSATPIGISIPVGIFAAGLNQNDNDLLRNSYRFATTLLVSSGLSWSIKIACKRKRPYMVFNDIVPKSSGKSWSFPSGHTTFAFATATSLTLTFPRWYVAIPSYLWAASVSYSRMYLGVHFPTDVLGGMALGIGVGFLVWGIDEYFLRK